MDVTVPTIPPQRTPGIDDKLLFTKTWWLFWNALKDFAARTSITLQYLLVTQNTGTLPADPSDTLVAIAGQDEHLARLLMEAFSTANNSPNLTMRRTRGTASAPSAIQTGDSIGVIAFQGMGATTLATGARFLAAAAENWTDAARGAYLAFLTTPTGSAVVAEVMRLLGSGALLIAATADNSTGAKLQVTGSASLSDSLILIEEAAPALSAAGQARLYADSTSHTTRLSENGGAYVDLTTSGLALFATGSSMLTLTNAYQDVPGCTITLTRAGLWKIDAYIDFTLALAHGAGYGLLVAATNPQAPTMSPVTTSAATDNLMSAGSWLFTAALNDVVKLQAKSNSGGGTANSNTTSQIVATWIHA